MTGLDTCRWLGRLNEIESKVLVRTEEKTLISEKRKHCKIVVEESGEWEMTREI